MGKDIRIVCAFMVTVLALPGTVSASAITNGSFESGDLTGWIATDLTSAFDLLTVASTGTVTAFSGFLGPNVVLPSDGGFAATHGFDGSGPGGPAAAISL